MSSSAKEMPVSVVYRIHTRCKATDSPYSTSTDLPVTLTDNLRS